MLDNRLKACAELVSGSGIVVDVGTDHGYLAVDLIKNQKCSRVIASDIKEGPLESARKNVEKYGVDDKVELMLTNGLEQIDLDDVSDVVIAGMGGETIVEILAANENIFSEEINLILQPMTKADQLRDWLGRYGFRICEERAVEDGERVYIVICAKYDGLGFAVSELKNIRGFVDVNDKAGRKYIEIQAAALLKKADALSAADREESALHYRVIAENLLNDDREPVSLDEIYHFFDSVYPFAVQEKWDNSGLLVDSAVPVSTILLSLDIDSEVVAEAVDSEVDLIVSHHPVIFEPLKRINWNDPVYKMIENGISAICMHTNLDIARTGTNGVILRKLMENFTLLNDPEPFEKCGDFGSLGYICTLSEPVAAEDFGSVLKEIFGCEYVRMNRSNCGIVSRVAFCSGSGGSMLDLAVKNGCDAYITGDVKHDVWISANNANITLFDCGHFHTENLVLNELRYVLEKKFPQIEVIIAESSVDPIKYI